MIFACLYLFVLFCWPCVCYDVYYGYIHLLRSEASTDSLPPPPPPHQSRLRLAEASHRQVVADVGHSLSVPLPLQAGSGQRMRQASKNFLLRQERDDDSRHEEQHLFFCLCTPRSETARRVQNGYWKGGVEREFYYWLIIISLFHFLVKICLCNEFCQSPYRGV